MNHPVQHQMHLFSNFNTSPKLLQLERNIVQLKLVHYLIICLDGLLASRHDIGKSDLRKIRVNNILICATFPKVYSL